jgi:hypothetical protein
VATLTTIQVPIDWTSFGFPAQFQTRNTCLLEGDPAWAWDTDPPELGIPETDTVAGESADGWDLDHVVLLVPDLDHTAASLQATLGAPRLRTSVQDRPTAFYRVGPLLEVIESPVRAPALFGVALVTEESLEETAIAWRQRGHQVTDPHPAIQPGREIITVKGTRAGFAVMSSDRAAV